MAQRPLKEAMSTSNSNTLLPTQHESSNTLTTPIIRSKRTHDDAFGKKKLERGIDVRREFNIAKSVSFLDAIFANPIMLQTLTAQEILRSKHVCKSWASASDDITIDKVRRHNQSIDWYFPLYATKDVGSPRMLQGMWHEHSSTSELLKLPPLTYLPPPTDPNAHKCICKALRKDIEYEVMASSGGLFLVETVNAIMTREGSYNPIIRHKRYSCFYRSNWPSLIVTNPITKLFQVLPIYTYGGDVDHFHNLVDSNGLQYHMMVDEIANSYKVLVLWSHGTVQLPPQLVVYNSRSKEWEDIGLEQSPGQPSLGSWDQPGYCTMYASTCMQGRFYIADIREPTAGESAINPLARSVVHLFEADMETPRQHLKVHTHIPLCRSYSDPQPMYPRDIVRNLELVECMGHLYAVIPAWKNEYLYEWNKERDNFWENVVSSTYLPIQFFIFQLDGRENGVEGHAGVLRIPVPTRRNCKHVIRSYSLSSKMIFFRLNKLIPGQNWFSCTARGSIIWMTIEDYLLKYDILSGESTMEILPKQLQSQRKLDFSYRASFHMKP